MQNPLPDEVLGYVKDVLGWQGPLTVQQFPSGYSNWTYGLEGEQQNWVLRRPPAGAKVVAGHDMAREFKVIQALHQKGFPVPRPIGLQADSERFGFSFFVMERVEGVILRPDHPSLKTLNAESFQALNRAFVQSLAHLHQPSPDHWGLADLGKGAGYVERQISGWGNRYQKAQTDDIPAMKRCFVWLAKQAPPEQGPSLIHNDYKYDNLVYEPDRLGQIRAVLDWEMATIGCPLMDLGCSLGYWCEPSDPPEMRVLNWTYRPGNWTREQVWSAYFKETGKPEVDPVFYLVFGLVRIGVIAQQIYARYKSGLTQDPRFATLIHAIRACAALAERAIAQGRISDLAA